MLRLRPTRKYRVSNRLAILAAVALTITAMAGLPDREDSSGDLTAQAPDKHGQEEPRAVTGDSVAHNGKLNISKLLFGHG
jgi:hypothetical protein